MGTTDKTASIETANTLLHRFEETDRERMIAYYGDPEVMAIRKYGARDPDAASAAFDVILDHWAEKSFGLFAAIERETALSWGNAASAGVREDGEVEIASASTPPSGGRVSTEGAASVTASDSPGSVTSSAGHAATTPAPPGAGEIGMTFERSFETPGLSARSSRYRITASGWQRLSQGAGAV